MRARLTLSLFCIALILSACAALADPFDTPAWKEEVNIDIKDLKLGDLLDLLIAPTATSYSVDPDAKFIKVPSLMVAALPRQKAFRALLKSAGLTYSIVGDKIVVSIKPGTKNVWLTHTSLDVTEATLGEAIACLFRDTGINYVIDPGAANLRIASIKLHDVTLYEALDTVLGSAGAKSVDKAGVVNIMPKSVPVRQVNTTPSGLVNVSFKPGDEDPWNRRMDIEVKDATFKHVIEEMFKSTGLNFCIDADCARLAVNSLKVTDVTFRDGLNAVMKAAGAVSRVEKGVVSIRAKTPPVAATNPISLDLKDVALPRALDALFKGTNLNYALDPNISQLHVTAHVTNVPFQSALESFATATGLTYRIEGGMYKISSASPPATERGSDVPGDKCTEEITLKQTTADYIMQVMGFDVDGKPLTNQSAESGGSRPAVAPVGIESITPGKSENTVVIVGGRKAVDDLKYTIAGLDVTLRAIQIAVEFYEYDSDAQITDTPEGSCPKAGAEPFSKAVISVPNGVRAEMPLQGFFPLAITPGNGKPVSFKTTILVAPSINEDRTITTRLQVSHYYWYWIPETGRYAPTSGILTSQKRLVAGVPTLIGSFTTRPGKKACLFVTAKVMD